MMFLNRKTYYNENREMIFLLGFMFSVVVTKKKVPFKEEEKEPGTWYRRIKVVSEGECETNQPDIFSTGLYSTHMYLHTCNIWLSVAQFETKNIKNCLMLAMETMTTLGQTNISVSHRPHIAEILKGFFGSWEYCRVDEEAGCSGKQMQMKGLEG